MSIAESELLSDLKDYPVLLSQEDVVKITGGSQSAISRLFSSVGFPVIMIGTKKYVRKTAFAHWLAEREVTRQRARKLKCL